MAARLTPDERRDLLNRSCDHSNGMTPAMRNEARRRLHEDDLAAAAELNELIPSLRLAATADADADNPALTWEERLTRLATRVQAIALYVLTLHDGLRAELDSEPYQEPESRPLRVLPEAGQAAPTSPASGWPLTQDEVTRLTEPGRLDGEQR